MYGILDDAGKEIAQKQQAIVALQDELRALYRQRPGRPVQDYELTRASGEKVRLSALLGDKDRLILVHNMGKSCPYCTMWADGFNGLAAPLQERFAFVVTTPDDPDTQTAFAGERGWSLPMVSTAGTSFAAALGFQTEHNGQNYLMPGASVIRRAEGGDGLELLSQTPFGPGDFYNSVFSFVDLAGLAPESDEDAA